VADPTDVLDERLTRAQARVEKVFLDECIITFDAEGLDDDVLDEDTGDLVAPAEDSAPLYTGRCSVAPTNRVVDDVSLDADQHAAQRKDPHYEFLGPLAEVPKLPIGALVRITASRRDPQLVDRVFRVADRPATSTFSVLRTASLEVT
jgi:hypothetical protein